MKAERIDDQGSGDFITRLGNILSELHEGVTIADENGIFVYASPSCRETFHVDPQQIIGRSAKLVEENGIFRPCITSQVLCKRQRLRSVQKNREGRELLVTGVPLLDGDGQMTGVICYSSWNIADYEELKSNYEELKQDNLQLKQELRELRKMKGYAQEIIERSKTTRDNIRLLQKFAHTDTPVMLSGPNGSGKRFLAHCVFAIDREYNCELVSEEMLARDLFGGSDSEKGILQKTTAETILLLHAENLSVELKKRLAEYIKEGASKIILTSEQSLEQMKSQDRTPDAFYYLFRVGEIQVHPLRERIEDLSGYLEYYLALYNEKYGRHVTFKPAAMECLLNYAWPENINEIKYILERIVLTAEEESVNVYQLPKQISSSSEEYFSRTSLKDAMEFYEKGIIQRAYDKYKTTVRVAQELGISQATAVRKIQKYVTEKQ